MLEGLKLKVAGDSVAAFKLTARYSDCDQQCVIKLDTGLPVHASTRLINLTNF